MNIACGQVVLLPPHRQGATRSASKFLCTASVFCLCLLVSVPSDYACHRFANDESWCASLILGYLQTCNGKRGVMTEGESMTEIAVGRPPHV